VRGEMQRRLGFMSQVPYTKPAVRIPCIVQVQILSHLPISD